MKRMEIGNALLIGAIKGLVSEGETVRMEIEHFDGDMAAISISPEELRGLRQYLREGEFEVPLYGYEEAYLENLSNFGAVKAPAPCYVEAVRTTEKIGIPLVPLDMDDESFADTYIEHVSKREFIAHMLRERKMERKAFRVEGVEDYVLKWDRYINRIKGLRAVEDAREEHMAKKLAKISGKGRVIAVIDFERFEGVAERMAKYL